MSNIICTICHESIAQKAEGGSGDDLVIIGMTCGHIFHFPCIKRWFIRSGNGDEDASIGPCPCCQTTVSLHHGLRLFHSSDEAEAVEEKNCRQCLTLIKLVHEQAETAEAVESDVRKLRCENARKTAELQKVQKQLEDEKKRRQGCRWNDQDENVSDEIREKGEDILDDIRQKGEDLLEEVQQKGDELLENIQEKGDELLQELRESGDKLRDGYGSGVNLHDILSRGQGLLDNFRRSGDTLRNDIQRAGEAFRNDFQRDFRQGQTGGTLRSGIMRAGEALRNEIQRARDRRDALNSTSTAQQDCTIV